MEVQARPYTIDVRSDALTVICKDIWVLKEADSDSWEVYDHLIRILI